MKRLFTILLVGFVALMVGCTTNEEPAVKPQMTLTKGTATEYSVTFTVETQAVERVAYLYTDNIAEAPSAETVLAEGFKIDGNKAVEVAISDLEADVTYTIVVAASGGGQVISRSIDMTTEAKKPEPTPEYLYDVEMTTASRIPSAELGLQDNIFVIALKEESKDYTLGIVLIGDGTNNSILTEELYSVANENLMIEACEFLTADDEHIFVEGEVAVDFIDGIDNAYNLDITFKDEQGKLFHFTYEGVVENISIPEPEPEDVVLTSAKSTWKGQYHTVEFATADESIKLVADIYTYNYKFGYLYEGVYTVKNSGYSFAAGEIDYYYSSLTIDGVKAALDSGTIEVAINDDFTYNIVINIVDANGREFQNSYEGHIEGMSFEDGFKWVAASRNTIVNGAAGQFNITFKTAGTESADSITMDFYADADAERLPAGTYTISNSTEAGCVNLETLSFTTFSNGTPEINGGEVVVEWLGENDYKVLFRMTETDSRRTWVCDYEGEIYNMIIEKNDQELSFISANGYFSDDSGESYVYLVTDNGKQLKLGLIDLAWENSYITAGTYTVGDNWGVGMITSGWYGNDWNDGIGFKSGSAIFEDNGDQTYTITVNITLTNDEVCSGVYVGAIEGYTLPAADDGGDDSSVVELTIDHITAKHYSNFNYGVQLFTPGSTLTTPGFGQSVAYLNLDFYDLEANTSSITPGTYTVGGATVGHLDSAYTKISFGMSESKATSGEAVFTLNDDDTYTITFAITCQDGLTYKGSYTGAIVFN